jgi:glycosyltransferase involved in cell wall biosynthesis
MKIALVVHKFPPTSLGGTEVYAQDLARAFTQLGHKVFVFYRDNKETHQFVEERQDRGSFIAWRVGLPFDASKAHPVATFLDTFFNPAIERSYHRFLEQVQPDLVHFQHLMLLSYRLVSQTRQRSIPTLLTFHDYWFVCANAQLIRYDGKVCRSKKSGLSCARAAMMRAGNGIWSLAYPGIWAMLLLRDRLVRNASFKADRWIAPSRFLIEQYALRNFPPSRFTMLENGVSVKQIRKFPRSEVKDAVIRISYVGSLAWQKGVHILVQAVNQFSKDSLTLNIYGDPTTFPEYSTQLRMYANPENTSFKGKVPNEQVGKIYAASDLVALPSLWYENSPVVIQEAFAAKVPVIASRIGALKEKVRDGIDGILIDPGNVDIWREELKRLVDTPDIITELCSNISTPLSIEKHAKCLETLYSDSL